jgi:drug/metabolite transporter (DMT)-like permease
MRRFGFQALLATLLFLGASIATCVFVLASPMPQFQASVQLWLGAVLCSSLASSLGRRIADEAVPRSLGRYAAFALALLAALIAVCFLVRVNLR